MPITLYWARNLQFVQIIISKPFYCSLNTVVDYVLLLVKPY